LQIRNRTETDVILHICDRYIPVARIYYTIVYRVWVAAL
jgi:hypothetical protein